MPHKKYLVTLTPEERQQLTGMLSAGKASALVLTRARILLKADQADGGPAWEDAQIAEALDCGHRTVERVRQRPSRDRILTPVVTAYRALRQVLHGHTAASGLRHLAGLSLTRSASCQARGRLSVRFFWQLLRVVTGRLRGGDPKRPGDRWRGHRVWLIDGTSFSMPDTAQREEWCQFIFCLRPAAQKPSNMN
jgi:hypothetical protein